MKRLQIYIEEDLDSALAVESRRRGTSKAALIREYVADRLAGKSKDPLDEIIGLVDGDEQDSVLVNAVVYGAQ